MKSIIKSTLFYLLLVGIASSITLTSCSNDDDGEGIDENAIELFSFGPSPALRGSEIVFIGQNLDRVSEIVLSDNVSVTSFVEQSTDEIVIVLPEETVNGHVVLKTPQGDITSKSTLRISEPITITEFSPIEARPGDVVTISGTYLNLIEEVIFNNNKPVDKSAFQSQQQEKIEVVIPEDAQTGRIVVSNGMEMPILVESEIDLIVVLPEITSFSPNPVKAGDVLTINGSNLDLIKELIFPGNIKDTMFVSQAIDAMEVQVPTNAQDGNLRATVASLQEITSTATLTLVVPGINTIMPNPAKPGTEIVIEGSDMDLVTGVSFGGGVSGGINSQDISAVTVSVPLEATVDVVTLHTAANKTSVSAENLELIAPVVNGLSASEIKANEELVISGTDLDLAIEVRFGGGTTATPTINSAEELAVIVPTGSSDDVVTVVTANGTEVSSSETLVILPSEIPIIAGYPMSAKPGELITLTGEKLDLQMDVIFPGDAPATQFGVKSPTMLEVVVPQEVEKGVGVITFITSLGESTTSPEINFQGVDPVADPALVFFDFDGTGAKDSWWGVINDGNVGGIENDPNISLDGTSYARVNGDLSGWNALFFRNGANNFPGATVGTSISDYVLKFDINIMEPITDGEILIRFRGDNDHDYFYSWKPWSQSGSYMTDGWITITIPLTDMGCQDYSIIDEDFGMAFNDGDSKVNAAFDNVRFELR